MFIFNSGAWGQTTEHLPPTRRYSFQPLATSASSVNLTRKPTLKTRVRSLGMFIKKKKNKYVICFVFLNILENIHQTSINSESILTNRFNPSHSLSPTIAHHTTTDDEEDDDDDGDGGDTVSVIHTRF